MNVERTSVLLWGAALLMAGHLAQALGQLAEARAEPSPPEALAWVPVCGAAEAPSGPPSASSVPYTEVIRTFHWMSWTGDVRSGFRCR